MGGFDNALPFLLFRRYFMSSFFFKSLLGIGMLVSALIAVFTMFEIFGRSEKNMILRN